MFKSKKLGAVCCAAVLAVTCAVPAFAAESQISGNAESETVYTQSVDVPIQVVSYSSTSSKTVTANKSLGLVLDPGKSGTSEMISFRLTMLPSNAKVRSIEIDPGSAIINNNNRNMLGLVVFSSLDLTSPNGKSATITWDPKGMKDTTHFLNQNASGTWTACAFGTNFARPTGDHMLDLRSVGSISYKSVKMTVSYVLE